VHDEADAPEPARDGHGDDWQRLGAAIRELRHRSGLTMVALAAAAELSQPFLSQVENGRARPSMESLYRLARALDTTPQALFGVRSSAPAEPAVVRADERGSGTPVLERDPASAVRLLLPTDAPFHVLEFDGLPGEFLEHWSHDGFEAVYVLAGEVEVELDGQLTRLSAGDFVSYPARRPHRHRAVPGPVRARVLMIETAVDALQEPRPGNHVPG
jgi:quercetin dioxygenase-like cupin family protein